MRGPDIHVVPFGERWVVEAGNGRGRETFGTRADAIASGTIRAKTKNVELQIHGRDGQIREPGSVGSDPSDRERSKAEEG
uniref:DUF2188 domain-containing protein n=1 Tax=Cupriavidus taiwanensis TaxID=164546 RepID=UPI003F4949E3